MPSLLSSLFRRLRGQPLPRSYQMPYGLGATERLGLSDEALIQWLESASESEVSPFLLQGDEQSNLVARHLPARLMTEGLLLAAVGNGHHEGRQRALLENPAFGVEQVRMLLQRQVQDLEFCDWASGMRQRTIGEEEGVSRAEIRARGFRALVRRGALAHLAGQEELLEEWLQSLQGPPEREPSNTLRRYSTEALLAQEAFEISDEMLIRIGQALPHEFMLLERALGMARTPAVASALWKVVPKELVRNWAVLCSRNEVALRSREVRSRILAEIGGFRQSAEDGGLAADAARRLRVAAIQDCSATEYPAALEALWQEEAEMARKAIARYPPPPGTELPRDLAARLLAGGSVDERLAVMRSLGTPAPAYAAPAANPNVRTLQRAPSPVTAPEPRSGRRR